MTERNCPSDDELVAWLHGKLDAKTAETVEQHCANCASCDTRLVKIESGDSIGRIFRELGAMESLATTSSVEPENADEQPTLDGFEIIAEIGRGGMGVVYSARHLKLDRQVAIKVMQSHRTQSREHARRFAREMRAIGKIDHPNIVRALDANAVDGREFLVMELIHGKNVSELYSGTTLPISDACEIVRQVAIGMHHVHEKGMVHRDIKPSNLMLTCGGIVKILDLGLARLDSVDANELSATNSAQILGTIDFMAPEQGANSAMVGPHSDVYSLGATFFRLLTGVSPINPSGNRSVMEKLTALASHDVPLLKDLRSDVPAQVVAIVDRAMASNPGERFQSAKEFEEAVAPFAAENRLAGRIAAEVGEADGHRLAETWPSRRSPKERVSLGVAILAMALLLGIVGWHLTHTFFAQSTSKDRNQTERLSPEAPQIRCISGDDNLLDFEAVTVWPDYGFHYTDFMLSLNGETVAMVSANKRLRICDLQTGEPIHRLNENSDFIRCAFHPDGEQLVSCERHRLSLYDVGSGEILQALEQDRDVLIEDVAFSADGTILVVASDRGIQFHDPRTLKMLRRVERNGWTGSLSVSPANHVFSTSSSRLVQLPADSEGFEICDWQVDDSSRVRFGHDQSAFFAFRNHAEESSNLVALDEENLEVKRSYDFNGRSLAAFTLLQKGRLLLAGGDEGKIQLFDSSSTAALATYQVDGGGVITRLLFNRVTQQLVVIVDHINILVFQLRLSKQCQLRFAEPAERPLAGLECAPETWTEDEDVSQRLGGLVPKVSSLPAGKAFQVYSKSPGYSEFNELLFSPDGRWMACCNHHCVRIYETSTKRLMKIVPGFAIGDKFLQWSGDSQWLAIRTEGIPNRHMGRYLFVAMDDSSNVSFGVPNRQQHQAVGWRPGHNEFAIMDYRNGSCRIVDPAKQEIRTFVSQRCHRSINWSPDGRFVAVVPVKGPVELWDADGKLVTVLGTSTVAAALELDSDRAIPLSWRSDGREVAFATTSAVESWQVVEDGTAERTASWSLSNVVQLAFRPGSHQVLASVRGRDVYLLKSNQRENVHSPGSPTAVELTWLDEDRFVARTLGGYMSLNSLKSGFSKEIGYNRGPSFGERASWTADRTGIAIGGWGKLTRIRIDDMNHENTTLIHRSVSRNNCQFRASWSPDNSQVASIDWMGQIRMHHEAEQSESSYISGLPLFLSCDIDQDGNRIATGTRSGETWIWATGNGVESILPVSQPVVADVDWHRNGRNLLTAKGNECFEVWDVVTQQRLARRHDQIPSSSMIPIGCASFHPQSDAIAVIGSDTKTRIWNWMDGKIEQTSKIGSGSITWCRDDGQMLLQEPRLPGNRNAWLQWLHVPTLAENKTMLPDLPTCLAVNRTGNKIAVAGAGITVTFLDRDGGALSQVAAERIRSLLTSICWHPSDEYVAACNETDIFTWKEDGSPGPPIEHARWLPETTLVKFTPDARFLIGVGKNRIAYWDAKTGKLAKIGFALPNQQAVVLSPCGEILWETENARDQLVKTSLERDEFGVIELTD